MSKIDKCLGTITNILDEEKFIVEVTVKGLFESLIAYPVDFLKKPEIQDTVLLHFLDSDLLGQSLMYQIVRLSDTTKISLGNNIIEISKSDINIKTEGASLTLDESGNINIDSDKELNIRCNEKVSIEGNEIEIKSGVLITKLDQSFVCPYTKQIHIMSTLK